MIFIFILGAYMGYKKEPLPGDYSQTNLVLPYSHKDLYYFLKEPCDV